MTGEQELRTAIIGLLGFAAAEEQMLLAAAPADEPGGPRCWAALHAVATASYLAAPDPARGMASYNLACAQTRANLPDQAAAALREAVTLNPDVRANARRDPDLATLRASGRLGAVL